MQRVSSNLTLALVLFVPIFWTTFFGALTLAVWVYRFDYYGSLPGPALRYGVLLFWLAGIAFFFLTFWRLKRVEVDELYLYVTNYFKHVRYPLDQIASIAVMDRLLFRTVHINLKAGGSFGRHIVFLPTGRAFEEFVATRPDLSAKLKGSSAD